LVARLGAHHPVPVAAAGATARGLHDQLDRGDAPPGPQGDQDPRRVPRRAGRDHPGSHTEHRTPSELVRHRAASAHAGAADPIFATRYGTHISAHNIRRVLRPIVKDLGLEWVTPHVFRHSLATQLRDAGYDANAIARVLGHSDPS
jgi:integrase